MGMPAQEYHSSERAAASISEPPSIPRLLRELMHSLTSLVKREYQGTDYEMYDLDFDHPSIQCRRMIDDVDRVRVELAIRLRCETDACVEDFPILSKPSDYHVPTDDGPQSDWAECLLVELDEIKELLAKPHPPTSSPSGWLRVNEVAKLLHEKDYRVSKLASNGDLRAIGEGHERRIDANAVIRYAIDKGLVLESYWLNEE